MLYQKSSPQGPRLKSSPQGPRLKCQVPPLPERVVGFLDHQKYNKISSAPYHDSTRLVYEVYREH